MAKRLDLWIAVAKKRWKTICLVVVAAAIVGAALSKRESEPKYKGKRLSYWLETQETDANGQTNPKAEEGLVAIRSIGTNAIPTLMRWAFYTPSIWKTKGLKLLDSLPYGGRVKHEIYPGRAEAHTQLALTGFSVLQKEARVVIPEVVRIMNAQRDSPDWSMLILRCLGDEGIPALVQVITNTSNPPAFRACATKYVGWEATNSGWAVAPLVRCLQEKDVELVAGVARALGQLAQVPEIAVPALAGKLQDSEVYVRVNATASLGAFGSAADSAMPALIGVLNDPDVDVRKATTNAVRRIAAEKLETPGHRSDASRTLLQQPLAKD